MGTSDGKPSSARTRGLKAARRLEESLGLVRRARAHVGRRAPTLTAQKHHRRARKQLLKLAMVLAELQRLLIERGTSQGHLDQLDEVLGPLDEVLRATRVGESRTRVFKRVRRAAKRARHAIVL